MVLIPSKIKIAIAITLVMSAFWAGWSVKGWRVDSKLAKDKSQVESIIKKLSQDNRDLVSQVQEKTIETQIIYRDIIKEVPRETSGDVCFGAGAARVWNDAFAAIRSMPEDSTGTPSASNGADSTDKVEYTDTEVLQNQVENAELWKQQRDRLNAIIEWDKKTFGQTVAND